jgi:hypothetical protein
MNNLEEILKIIELLNSRAVIDIKTNDINRPHKQSVNIKSYLTYARDIHEYVMVCIQDHEVLNIDNLIKQAGIHFVHINDYSVHDHYPVNHLYLSPLNVIDLYCRRACSIIMFSNSLTSKDILVSFTHSEGKMEIPFMELKIILEVSGAKIRQYNP